MASTKMAKLGSFLFLLLLPLTFALPNDHPTLTKREEPVESCGPDMHITYSLCNSCVPTDDGEGPPECDNEPYYHNGADGEYSCSDEQVPFNDDFCSTFGKLPTPLGDGDWYPFASCDSNASPGSAGGTITVSGTDPYKTCTCYNSDASGSDFCGEEYTCTEVWSCVCNQCTYQ